METLYLPQIYPVKILPKSALKYLPDSDEHQNYVAAELSPAAKPAASPPARPRREQTAEEGDNGDNQKGRVNPRARRAQANPDGQRVDTGGKRLHRQGTPGQPTGGTSLRLVFIFDSIPNKKEPCAARPLVRTQFSFIKTSQWAAPNRRDVHILLT